MLENLLHVANSVPFWNTLLGLTSFGAFCSVLFLAGLFVKD